jgi:DNA polymerase (family 10)
MLEQLAALATIRGDGADAALFTAGAALVGARRIESDADLGPLVEEPPPGTDPQLLARLRYMYDTGGWVLLESAIADLPADLRWLFESGAVTIEELARMHTALGVTSATDLAAEAARQTIRHVPGLDERVETAVASALPTLRAALPRIPLGRATAIVHPVLAALAEAPGVIFAEPVGSLRRGHDMVGDIEVIAPTTDVRAALDRVLQLPDIARTLHRAATRLYILIDRVQVGVRCPPPEEAGAALLSLTGSARHLRALQTLALERGGRLGPEGLLASGSTRPIAATETDIYHALGLPLIPPEIRNGDGEIEAAAAGSLPTLVSRADIRGDLHMHTQWSDGRDSIEAMVQAALALGYEYLAITDHSPHSSAARNLSADSVKRQAEEIEGLRTRYPRIALLHGCEVDILADGRLDFRDHILERFDIVLASLHERAGHSPEQLLNRYLSAMRHPLVSVITHPTNRLVPYRPGYDLDYDRFFSAAVETGTAVEIDGSPAHLDLDGALARRAIAAGATVVIDSDCHRADMLDRQMRLGIVTARRGWVEAKHVLNARPLADVRALIAAKRSR